MTDDFVPPGTEIDLTNCEREPIHIPGSIQPHGVLLTALSPDGPVQQVSSNCAQVFGRTPQEVLGTPLVELFHPLSTRMLRRALAEPEGERMIFPWRVAVAAHADAAGAAAGDPVFHDLLCHHRDGLWVLELEPSQEQQAPDHLLVGEDSAVSRLNAATSVSELLEQATVLMRQITGFDRVMLYRFDPEWNGQVVAEDRREDLEPFLGLHYPASDIPPQARALYTVNWLRFIRDVTAGNAPLVPQLDPVNDAPLDLSGAALRSVSPIHVEYLTNMGVTASMSVSLVIDGTLAGLIACHHYSGPFVPSATVRATAEFLATTISWLLESRERAERNDRTSTIWQGLLDFRHRAEAPGVDTGELVAGHAEELMHILGAEGMAWSLGGVTASVGTAPADADLRRIRRWAADEAAPDLVVHTDRLPSHVPDLDDPDQQASGLLMLNLADDQDLMFFRPEVVQDVDWAGDPRKAVVVTETGEPRLSPRGSFALWRETVRGRSKEWDPAEVDAAHQLGSHLLQVL